MQIVLVMHVGVNYVCVIHKTTFSLAQGRQSEQELSDVRSRVSLLESDLQAAELEKNNLIRKVQLLQRAMESPDSKLKLKRMLER